MILLLGNDEAERARVLSFLKETKAEAAAPKDGQELQATLRDHAIKLIFVCVGAGDASLVNFVKSLDQMRGQRSSPIVVVSDELSDEVWTNVVKAGADGEIRRRRSRDYVLGHAEAMLRLARRPATESLLTEARRAVVAPPPAPVVAGSPCDVVVQAAGWRDARELLRGAATKFLTLPAHLASTRSAESDLAAGCQILMGNAKDQVEMRLAVGADRKSIRLLAMHVFGDDGEEMGAELLPELTNIFMGTLKTALSNESVAFAAGLPETLAAARVLHPPVIYSAQESFELQVSDARITIYLGVRSSGSAFVPVGGLREGMVLARDVFNPKGLMLICGGTRLSLNMIEKLRSMLTHKQEVEVLAA